MPKEVQLTRGQVTIVDNEDYARVIQYKWYACYSKNGNYYAYRYNPATYGVQSITAFLLQTTRGTLVDHANGNTLDNRRTNIRVATIAQNNYNQSKREGMSSQYKGVSWDSRRGRWVAKITREYKSKFLGYYHNEWEAAKAYDVAAVEYFGEFARLNFEIPNASI